MIRVRTRMCGFVVACLSVFFSISVFDAHAALLYFDPPSAEIFRGDSITVNLRIDTDADECINTVDAVVHYDPNIRAVDVSRGDSILNIWVEDPVIDETAHTITFAGGIPGGYCGRIPVDPSLTNVLEELVFISPGFAIGAGDNPTARIWMSDSTQVLLHDGYGTNAQLRLQDAMISLLPKAGSAPTDAWRDKVQEDTELPSDFTITLSQDEVAFSGRHFITFNAVDKQSGMDHYEVMEEPFAEFAAFRWGRADAPWIQTESPYVLEDQSLNSTIRVKAIDKAGNERIATLVPDEAKRGWSNDFITMMVISGTVLVLLVALLSFVLWRRRQRLLTTLNNN